MHTWYAAIGLVPTEQSLLLSLHRVCISKCGNRFFLVGFPFRFTYSASMRVNMKEMSELMVRVFILRKAEQETCNTAQVSKSLLGSSNSFKMRPFSTLKIRPHPFDLRKKHLLQYGAVGWARLEAHPWLPDLPAVPLRTPRRGLWVGACCGNTLRAVNGLPSSQAWNSRYD